MNLNWRIGFLVISTMAIEGAVARGTRSCPRSCGKDLFPVCGSDLVIYPNMCELRFANCKKRQLGEEIYLLPEEKCTQTEGSKCDHRCNGLYDPVCGSNGRTYLNICIFRVEQCRSGLNGITLSHYGPCHEAVVNKSSLCPETCADASEDGPICASDGNVYNSTCDMLKRTCGQKVVKTNYQHCKTTEKCQDVCFYDYKPSCGSNGLIYQSRCQMKVKNCGRHIYEMPMVNCRPQERLTSGCPISCKSEKLSPVCGSDGHIYDNECDMKRLTCGSSNALNIYSIPLQSCRGKFEKCSRIMCPGTYDPVCGTDGTVYANYCHMHKANCHKGVKMAHYGECADIDEDCVTPCIKLADEDHLPVCGSDGNVYKSACDMKKRTCGQRVVAVALHHCERTKHCFSECKDVKGAAAVCGSDNRMYRNACEMKAKNCGGHVYEVPLSKCLKGFNFFRCMRFCPPVFDPVCGTDGKTYSNECFLKMENCRSRSLGRSLVTRTYFGKCGHPQPQPKLYMFR